MQRITIMIDDDLLKKLHSQQAEIIKKTMKGCSLSKVINQNLKKVLK